MDGYLLTLTLIGLAALSMAWMPGISQRTHVSYAILFVVFGIAVYSVIDVLPWPDPLLEGEAVVHITELVVIISLMGCGLRIDEPFSFRVWRVPFLLVSFTMVLSIAIVAGLGFWLFDLDIATSILLGAVLAPTDPVLASDVQVGPPLEKSRNNVRFSLTAEGGLNDGMAFPFTWLAIVVATSATGDFSLGQWLLKDVIYRIACGVLLGYALGRLLAYLLFRLPERGNYIVTRDGFVAISATLLVYGLTELCHGYGFVSVFVCAITMRNYEMNHEYHLKLHAFTEQVERILMAIVLILFGGAVANGILTELTWTHFAFSIILIFIARPVSAFFPLIGTPLHRKEKIAISFLGIRGIGTFFYLAFALQKADFQEEKLLWSIVSLVVLSSIIIHGLTANLMMKRIEK